MEHMQQAAKGQRTEGRFVRRSRIAGGRAGRPEARQRPRVRTHRNREVRRAPANRRNRNPMVSHSPPRRRADRQPRTNRNRRKPDESPAGASGQPDGAAKQSPGQPPADKSQGAGQPQQGSSGSDATPQGPTEQQGGEPKPSPSGSGQQKEPGQSDGRTIRLGAAEREPRRFGQRSESRGHQPKAAIFRRRRAAAQPGSRNRPA